MKISGKILAIVLGTALIVGVASASIIANFVVPTSVNVTVQPGIEVDLYPAGGRLTSLSFGDVQTGTSGQVQIIMINTGGNTVFIIPGQSLTTSPAPPTGITLTWDLLATAQLNPAQSTSPILLKLSVAATAPAGPASWTTTFNAFSTASG
jgi:hypothetical protein